MKDSPCEMEQFGCWRQGPFNNSADDVCDVKERCAGHFLPAVGGFL